jgi:cysteine-rich repeat protein
VKKDRFYSTISSCVLIVSWLLVACSQPLQETCGNNQIDDGEECDGDHFGGQSCVVRGFDNGVLACNSDCSIDDSGCSDTVLEICDNNLDDDNNGQADCADAACAAEPVCIDEICDNNIDDDGDGDKDCADPDCDTDSICFCGNGDIDAAEQCDGNNLNNQSCATEGFSGGLLICNADCTLNPAGCINVTCNHDGATDAQEQCDDENFNNGDGCDDCIFSPDFEQEGNNSQANANDFALLDINHDGSLKGEISVSGDVDFFKITVQAGSTADLIATTSDGPLGFICDLFGLQLIFSDVEILDSNGALIEPNEGNGADFCSTLIATELPPGDYFVSVRSSGIEIFDYTLNLDIKPNICGDGETSFSLPCDGANLDSQACTTLGFGSGTLSCLADCSDFNTSQCAPNICGDNFRGGFETCDGTDVDGTTCESEGFPGGTLGCTADCFNFDVSQCTPNVCGDGIVSFFTEDCDGTNVDDHTCEGEGFASGTLGCLSDCTFDTSQCDPVVCGDGIVSFFSGGEDCDGTNFFFTDCFSEGLSGTPLCINNCQDVDTSTCTPNVCGDGSVLQGEPCDDGNNTNGDGCDAACQLEEGFFCAFLDPSFCFPEFRCEPGETLLTLPASGLPRAIPDGGVIGLKSIVNTTDPHIVKRVMVKISSITHSFDTDLQIFLRGPNNITVPISIESGSNFGNNEDYLNTVIDDACDDFSFDMSLADAPFTGCFSPFNFPFNSLAPLSGIPASGSWILQVFDSFEGDAGTLDAWTLALCVQ